MRKKKTFDCVQMKWDIQASIAKEFAGMSEEKAHAIQAKQIAENPILGPIVERIRTRYESSPFKKTI